MDKHRLLRRLAYLTAICFAWSFVLAASARAATYRPPVPPGDTRPLSMKEMQHIVGATAPIGGDPGGGSGTGGDNAGASSGPVMPWIGSVGNVNTATGNRLTTVPLVSWTARGGLPVGFSLYHASISQYGSGDSFGPKWNESYFSGLATFGNGNVTVYWDDQSAYTFTKNVNGTYSPPPGIHDTLTAVSGGYDLVTKDQVRYHFVYPFSQSGTSYVLLSSISDENGNTVTVNHTGTGALASIVDPSNRAITFGYSGGHLSTVTDPLGRVWTLTYDGSGRLAHVGLPHVGSDTTANYGFGYDASNDINSFGLLDGTSASAAYNADGTVATETDPCGNVTTFQYGVDLNGNSNANATTIVAPNGVKTTHFYANGRLDHVTDALQYAEYYGYDSDNNRTQVQDRRGYQWHYTFDGTGNCLSAQAPPTPENSSGNTVTTTYNGHNRPLTVSAPGGESVALTYDGNDNLTQVQSKDSGGSVKATTTFTVSASTHGLVTDRYDADSHHDQYGYNANGDLTDHWTHLRNHTQWAYDGLGVCTQRTDALSRTTVYGLDAWDRTISASYPDSGYNATYTYNERGALTAFSNYAGSFTRAYDGDGRMLNEYKGGGLQAQHTYDATAAQRGLLSTTTDCSSHTVTYGYDARGLLSSVQENGVTTAYAYDPDGRESGFSRTNGVHTAEGYDGAGRLTSLYNYYSSGGVVGSFDYTYNRDSQRVSCSDNQHGADYTYGYDGLGHLTSETRSSSASPYTNTYTVDAAGNRTQEVLSGQTTNLHYDADDELTSTDGAIGNTYGYDADGQQTYRTYGSGYNLGYDYDGQLRTVTPSGGGATVTYAYDALGRRLSRSAGGTTTVERYDGGRPIFEEVNGAGSQLVWGSALIRRDGEWPTFDGHGDRRVVLDGGQNTTSNLVSDAFGRTVGAGGTTALDFGWGAGSGYRGDLDAGLIEVGARYYDRETGRFTSRDTDLGQSAYVYCGGDPVNFTDPSGHDASPTNPPLQIPTPTLPPYKPPTIPLPDPSYNLDITNLLGGNVGGSTMAGPPAGGAKTNGGAAKRPPIIITGGYTQGAPGKPDSYRVGIKGGPGGQDSATFTHSTDGSWSIDGAWEFQP